MGPEAELLEDAYALSVTHASAHHLLDVDVLEGQRVELVRLPGLPDASELSLPASMSPLRVHVADALHPEAEEGLELDHVACPGAVNERDLAGQVPPGPLLEGDPVRHRRHDL